MTTHIRIRLRGQPGHFFCGAREFMPGEPNKRGSFRPMKDCCAECYKKWKANHLTRKLVPGMPKGLFF